MIREMIVASLIPRQAEAKDLGRRSVWSCHEIEALLGGPFTLHPVKKPTGDCQIAVLKDRENLPWNITAGVMGGFFITGPTVFFLPGEELVF